MRGTIHLGYVGWLLFLAAFLLFGIYLELRETDKTLKSIETELVKLNNDGEHNELFINDAI